MLTDVPAPDLPGLPPLTVIQAADQAAALLQPERQRLLEALAEPDSAAGLARRFALPRQRLNYHLKELERVGLVSLVDQRRKGNCVERVVRATARSYVISPDALGALAASRPSMLDRFSATHAVALAARAIRELGRLMERAAATGRRLATLSVDTEVRFRSADARAQFAHDLADAVAALAARYHDADAPGGRTFRVVASVYPRPSDASDPNTHQESAS